MEADTTSTAPKRRGVFSVILRALAVTFALLVLLMSVFSMRKIGAPGAPVAWGYAALAVAIVTAALQFPPAFYRLPRWGRIVVSFMLLGSLIIVATADQQMDPAWGKTPAGMKEAADRAKTEREAAAAKALEDARLKKERDAAAAEAAEQKQIDLDAKQLALCRDLEKSVVDLSNRGLSPIIEVNDIQVEHSDDLTKTLKCSGKAIMSRGEDRGVDFGLDTTPQGKTLVTMQLR